MGGIGSGRPPNVETLIAQKQPQLIRTEDTLFIPNYSGLQAVKKTDPTIGTGGGGTTRTMLKATFDITTNTAVITADGTGKKHYVCAISIHNNDTTSTNDTIVKITDGNGGTALIGGGTGAVYLVGRGGFFGLPMSSEYAWFNTSANTALYINPVSSKRVAGAVWYYTDT